MSSGCFGDRLNMVGADVILVFVGGAGFRLFRGLGWARGTHLLVALAATLAQVVPASRYQVAG